MAPLLTVLADDLAEPVAPGWQLVTATLVAITYWPSPVALVSSMSSQS